MFGFCVALLAYNVLALAKAALRSVYGEQTIADEVSGYYPALCSSRTLAKISELGRGLAE